MGFLPPANEVWGQVKMFTGVCLSTGGCPVLGGCLVQVRGCVPAPGGCLIWGCLIPGGAWSGGVCLVRGGGSAWSRGPLGWAVRILLECILVFQKVQATSTQERDSWYHLGGLISGCILVATAAIIGTICYVKRYDKKTHFLLSILRFFSGHTVK